MFIIYIKQIFVSFQPTITVDLIPFVCERLRERVATTVSSSIEKPSYLVPSYASHLHSLLIKEKVPLTAEAMIVRPIHISPLHSLINGYKPRLSNSVTSVGSLLVIVRVEIDVMNDNRVGRRQVDSVTTRLESKTRQGKQVRSIVL